MRKIVITLGSVAGLVLVLMLALSMIYMDRNFTDQVLRIGEIVGYASMIITLSLIFFGVRTYRDQYLGGSISFIRAFQVGIYITLVASAFYVVGWMLLSNLIAPDFIERYAEFTVQSMKEKGTSEEEIAATQISMDQYSQMYQNPLIKAAITFLEIFPVGLVITLLSASLLKRN